VTPQKSCPGASVWQSLYSKDKKRDVPLCLKQNPSFAHLLHSPTWEFKIILGALIKEASQHACGLDEKYYPNLAGRQSDAEECE